MVKEFIRSIEEILQKSTNQGLINICNNFIDKNSRGQYSSLSFILLLLLEVKKRDLSNKGELVAKLFNLFGRCLKEHPEKDVFVKRTIKILAKLREERSMANQDMIFLLTSSTINDFGIKWPL